MTGRGAGRAQCGNSTSTGRAERLHNNRLHQTRRPVNHLEHVCVEKCPLTTRHTAARSETTAEERVLITLESYDLRRERAPEAEAGNLTDQSIDSDHESGKAGTREPRPCRRRGGQPSSGAGASKLWSRTVSGGEGIFPSTCEDTSSTRAA